MIKNSSLPVISLALLVFSITYKGIGQEVYGAALFVSSAILFCTEYVVESIKEIKIGRKDLQDD